MQYLFDVSCLDKKSDKTGKFQETDSELYQQALQQLFGTRRRYIVDWHHLLHMPNLTLTNENWPFTLTSVQGEPFDSDIGIKLIRCNLIAEIAGTFVLADFNEIRERVQGRVNRFEADKPRIWKDIFARRKLN
ncbi:hypothetical protein vseg_018173 [Gypsophila vaccaria]